MAFVSLASDHRNSCCKGKFNHFSLFSDKLVLYQIVRQKCFHDDKKKKKKKKKPKNAQLEKFSETDIINMLGFLMTTYLLCLVDVFFNRQSALHMGTNCAPILTDLFLYSYEADLIQGLLK